MALDYPMDDRFKKHRARQDASRSERYAQNLRELVSALGRTRSFTAIKGSGRTSACDCQVPEARVTLPRMWLNSWVARSWVVTSFDDESRRYVYTLTELGMSVIRRCGREVKREAS